MYRLCNNLESFVDFRKARGNGKALELALGPPAPDEWQSFESFARGRMLEKGVTLFTNKHQVGRAAWCGLCGARQRVARCVAHAASERGCAEKARHASSWPSLRKTHDAATALAV